MYQVRAIVVFPVFRLLTDFVCLLTYEFCFFLWKIARCSVILLLPLLCNLSPLENNLTRVDTSACLPQTRDIIVYCLWHCSHYNYISNAANLMLNNNQSINGISDVINFQLYSINSDAADCTTGASVIYK